MAPLDVFAGALPVAALVVLLVAAVSHPRPAVEAGVALAAVGLTLAPGLVGRAPLDAGEVGTTLSDLAPVVAFLATILVVSEVCERSGLFAAAGALLRPGSTGSGSSGRPAVRLLTAAFVLAAVVTTVLSLDATVVLLVPVVVGAARAGGLSSRPGAYACLRMANSASLLLPVSNLTNLLALPHLDLTFLGFAARTAPVLVVVLIVEYVGLRLVFARDLAADAAAAPPVAPPPVPLVPVAVVVLMLAGFAVTSPLGVEPAWISGAAALLLVAWSARRREMTSADVVGSAQLPFALFVLALGVVVAAISADFGARLVGPLVPASLPGGLSAFVPLLGIAALATGLAAVLTNLSATLLVVPLVAPLGTDAVLAALIGLNAGSGLVLTGSLANLLWRRGMAGLGERATVAEFHRVSLLITPVTVVAAVATLAVLG